MATSSFPLHRLTLHDRQIFCLEFGDRACIQQLIGAASISISACINAIIVIIVLLTLFACVYQISSFVLLSSAYVVSCLASPGSPRLFLHPLSMSPCTPIPQLSQCSDSRSSILSCGVVCLVQAMSGVDKRIAELIECAVKDGGRVVSCVDSIIEILLKENMAYVMRVPPAMMGVHWANRDGYGVSASEVHAIGADIVHMGWSWLACKHAVAMEDDDDKKVEAFNFKLKNSAEELADTTEGEIKFGSLSCSHTNQFLHAVLAERPSSIESLSIDGHLSKSKLSERDPALADALAKGLEWVILKKEVAILYPRLPDLIQNARCFTHKTDAY